jgi:ribosomal protein L37AE/L43A
MREYQCPKCKRTRIVDRGDALWKIWTMRDRNREDAGE